MKSRKEITLEPEAMSREDQIAILQDKLKNADGRSVAAIQRRIDLLTGVDKPYCKTPAEQIQRTHALEPPPDPNGLPTWWNEHYCQTHLFWALCDVVSKPDFDGVITA